MQPSVISTTLRSALEPLRARKRFLLLIAEGAGGHQQRKHSWRGVETITTPPAWQDHDHPLHDLFLLERLDDDERLQLREQSQWKKNPNFPWGAFAKSLAMEIALPLAIMTMFKLYSPSQHRPNRADRELLTLACWGDEDSWLALVDQGNQCSWSATAMRSLLARQDTNSAIAAPIRMLAEPYDRNSWHLPKNRCVPYMDYAYRNCRETDQFRVWWDKKVTLEPLLQKALDSDAIFLSEIATTLSRHPRADVFASALIDHTCLRLVHDWLQKYSEAELGISRQDTAKLLLLHVRDQQPIIQILKVLESQRQGFARTVVAEDGGNLLWLATPPAEYRYMRRSREPHHVPINIAVIPNAPKPNLLPLFKFLVGELGVSPFQRNKRGFNFADYDLIARANDQRLALVGLDNSVPDFHDRQFWGIDRFENDDSNHFDKKNQPVHDPGQ